MQSTTEVSWKTGALLSLLGCASLFLYRFALQAGVSNIRWFIKIALLQSVFYLLASGIVLRARSSRSTVFLVITFAFLFRLSILFSPPYLSDDIYRYVWDGRVQSAGINPYRYIPAAPELGHLRDNDIYSRINRRDYAPTIYPPLAQGIFFLTTRFSESVTWMKVTMLGFELVALWAIAQLLSSMRLPRQRLIIYAWHPLIVWEFAGSGHVDAIAVAFIALAFFARYRNAHACAGFALACAALVKLFPLILFPFLYRRWGWKMPLAFLLTIIIGYLPYLDVGIQGVFGFLPGYAKEQGLVSGRQFYILSLIHKVFRADVPSFVFFVFALLLLSAITIWALRRNAEDEDGPGHALMPATAATVLFAPHYAWYFAWLIPFLCFSPLVAVFYLTIASFILYASWLGDSPDQMFTLNSSIYLPFLLFAIIEFFWRRTNPRSGSCR